MTDATSAAKAIQDRHQNEADYMISICHACDRAWPCSDHADAQVVLAHINEATTLNEQAQSAIRLGAYNLALGLLDTALAALKGEA